MKIELIKINDNYTVLEQWKCSHSDTGLQWDTSLIEPTKINSTSWN